jgi:hypothetical protein
LAGGVPTSSLIAKHPGPKKLVQPTAASRFVEVSGTTPPSPHLSILRHRGRSRHRNQPCRVRDPMAPADLAPVKLGFHRGERVRAARRDYVAESANVAISDTSNLGYTPALHE